jgi:hypothetical protein
MSKEVLARQRLIGPAIITSFENGKQRTKEEVAEICCAKIKEVKILIKKK